MKLLLDGRPLVTTNKKKQRRRDLQRPIAEGWRRDGYDLIFEADTPSGRWFDIGLLIAILLSISVIALETVNELSPYNNSFIAAERVLTILSMWLQV